MWENSLFGDTRSLYVCHDGSGGGEIFSTMKVKAVKMSGSHHIKHLSVTEGQVLEWIFHTAICIYVIIVYYTAT